MLRRQERESSRTASGGGHAAEALHMRLVGHCDLGGQGDGMHVNVTPDGYAYIGHMGYGTAGTSVVDVRDPRAPRLVAQVPRPEGTHTHKVQVVDDLLLVNHERNPWQADARAWSAGLAVLDISRRDAPREIAFLPTPGVGVHRMTFWEAPYAYVTGSDDGFLDQFLLIVDLSEPSRPREVGRWWYPGQHVAAGEPLSWRPATGHHGGAHERRVALHHALVRGARAYCGWWDAGLVVLDVSDPSRPSLVGQLDFAANEESGATHTALPVPGRDLLVVTDEQTADGPDSPTRHVRLVDISDDAHPHLVSRFPVPEGDFSARGGRFGPHNLHEMRPGSLVDSETIYLTYFSAGIRAVNIADPSRPREVAYFVPSAPPGRAAIQMNDLVVTRDGLIFATDRYAGGLYIVERSA